MSTSLRQAVVRAASVILACTAFAAMGAEKSPLLPQNDPVALPGVGRVLLGFAITVGLAVAIIYGIRRWFPRFAARYQNESESRLIVHSTVKNGLRLHIVTVGEQTVLVAEGKSGITMLPLDAAPKTNSGIQ